MKSQPTKTIRNIKKLTVAPTLADPTRKYYMIDKRMGFDLQQNPQLSLRVRGTTRCLPSRVAFMAQALGCVLMRHLPAELKGWDDSDSVRTKVASLQSQP